MKALVPGALLVAVLLSGCTYSVHQASVGGFSEIPKGAELRRIDAAGSDAVVLGLGADTEFVDRVWLDLQRECEGEIVAVEARYSTALSFLSYKEHVRMTGLCREGSASVIGGPHER